MNTNIGVFSSNNTFEEIDLGQAINSVFRVTGMVDFSKIEDDYQFVLISHPGQDNSIPVGTYFTSIEDVNQMATYIGPASKNQGILYIANLTGQMVYEQIGVRNEPGVLWTQSPSEPTCFSRFNIDSQIGLAQFDVASQQWIVVGAREQYFFVATGAKLDNLTAVGREIPDAGLYSIDYTPGDSLRLFYGTTANVLFDLALDYSNITSANGWSPFCFEPEVLPDTCLSSYTFPITRTMRTMQPINDLGLDTLISARDTTLLFNTPAPPTFALDVPECITDDNAIALDLGDGATDVYISQVDNTAVDSVGDFRTTADRTIELATLNNTTLDSFLIDYRYFNCPADTTIHYTIDLSPVYDVEAEYTLSCDPTGIEVDLEIINGEFDYWLSPVPVDASTDIQHEFFNAGIYTGRVQNGSCFDTFSVSVLTAVGCDTTIMEPPVVVAPAEIGLPNAFSPNNDANNDLFGLPIGSVLQIQRLQIFDRWGGYVADLDLNKSTTPNQVSVAWNGFPSNNSSEPPAASGVYAYLAKVFDTRTEETTLVVGDIHLIR